MCLKSGMPREGEGRFVADQKLICRHLDIPGIVPKADAGRLLRQTASIGISL